ncbi:TetR/AcrR family transcriptional regulator [Streptomyces nogalater]
MPAKTRRKRVTKSPDDRRDDILSAAERVFGTTGFERATISELAEAAEIGKGTFYLYFESKDHLLGALWERYVDAIVSTAQEILAERDAWWPTIDRVMSALIGHAVKNAELHRIVYGSANAKALELCAGQPASHRPDVRLRRAGHTPARSRRSTRASPSVWHTTRPTACWTTSSPKATTA